MLTNTDDIVYYELGRFVELLLQNNPNMMELLATPAIKVNIAILSLTA